LRGAFCSEVSLKLDYVYFAESKHVGSSTKPEFLVTVFQATFDIQLVEKPMLLHGIIVNRDIFCGLTQETETSTIREVDRSHFFLWILGESHKWQETNQTEQDVFHFVLVL